MVVNDGVIEWMGVEGGGVVENAIADPYEVSDADNVMEYLMSAEAAVGYSKKVAGTVA